MKQKIGIFGGSFNPIHNTHLKIAEQAAAQYGLSRVIIIPAGFPYFKATGNESETDLETPDHRLNMVNLATAGNPLFEVSDLEIRRGGNTYTVDTLEELCKDPETEYYLILGQDSLMDIDLWKNPERIFALAKILVCPRSERNETVKLERRISHLNLLYPGSSISLIDGVRSELSSTKIRKKLQKGSNVSSMIPDAVADYIRANGMYGTGEAAERAELFSGMPEGGTELSDLTDLSMDQILSKLKKKLDPKRYTHTMGVSYTAISLAMCYNEDILKAQIAGLLHDCAKYGRDEEKIEKCRKFGVELTEVEIQNPALIHAKLGAYYAETRFHVTDEEILKAICHHTTGVPGMSMLEKIIFIADYIEPGRKMLQGLPEIRQTAFRDLDLAVAMTLRHTVDYLLSKKGVIDETTIQTLDYYEKLISEREEKK